MSCNLGKLTQVPRGTIFRRRFRSNVIIFLLFCFRFTEHDADNCQCYQGEYLNQHKISVSLLLITQFHL